MILISHRGNIDGPSPNSENHPDYIDIAIKTGYDVEIDFWYINKKLFLGHDLPKYEIDNKWIQIRKNKLWVHCKNISGLFFLNQNYKDLNYFFHQSDDVTITSTGFFWTYPGKELTPNSIACLPESSDFENLEICYGICSDLVENYKQYLFK